MPSMHGRSEHGLTAIPTAGDCPLGRAIVLTGSIGSGHTRAAEAIVDEMLRTYAAEAARVVDCLAFSNAPFRALYRDAYLKLIERMPGAVGWLYRSSDTTGGGGMRRAVQRWSLARLRRLIAVERPDTIVCTHFLAAELLSGMVERGEWSGRFAVVVTDLDAHSMWAVCPRADHWFVAIPETCEILAGKGVARERITVTGIPISSAFLGRPAARTEVRAKLGLPANRPMILVSGGGVGVSGLSKTLLQLLDMPISCGVALVCGKNAALRAQAEKVVASRGDSQVRCAVLGFTDRMHELMHAADLAVGKPGGLTSSEALACGLPMAILNPVPGQEERNADHLLEWGVAIRLNSPESFGWRITELLQDRARLKRMRTAALARAKPLAAAAIVECMRRNDEDAANFTPRLVGGAASSFEGPGRQLVQGKQ